MASNFCATPAQQFHLRAIPGEFHGGQEKPGFQVETEGFQEGTITRAKTGWLRRMAGGGSESARGAVCGEESAKVLLALLEQ